MVRLMTVIGVCALMATGSAVVAQPAVEADSPDLRMSIAFGIDLWSELGDLQPILGGDFDEAGIALDVDLHGGGWKLGPARIFAGVDVGVIGNGSDVEGIQEREDLQTTLIYLTPSLKAVFRGGGRLGWTIDAGIGYYDVSIDEWEDDCFWDCDVQGYYDDSSVGGYAGLGVELPFPFGPDDGSLRLVGRARAHFVEFDEPTEIAQTGSLDGPIYVLSIGLGFYR